ncbi:MAG: cobalamin B12-binding domain-containing protein [Pseudomonadota bacterium]
MAESSETPSGDGVFTRLLDRSRRLFGNSKQAARDELASLSQLIEQEIIPRLQMRFSTAQITFSNEPATDDVLEYDVDGFVAALLSKSADDAADFIDRLRISEHSLLQVYEHLLAPAARRLGVMWEDDDCGFADVTIAIAKIRHLFVSTAPLFPVNPKPGSDDKPSILVTTVVGEQHTFGLYLVLEHFRAHDWNVWSGVPRSRNELIDIVSSERCDVVGLSIGSERHLPAAAETIKEIRKHATNPDVIVIAGGSVLQKQPDLAATLGADVIVEEVDDDVISKVTETVARNRSRSA